MLDFSEIQSKIVVICGATASGKSSFALEIASKIDGVIINADAMQVYRELPILTAQPSDKDQQLFEHRLYSIIGIQNYYSVAIWLNLVKKEITEVKKAGKVPIIIGGSGLYIKSLIDGLAFIPDISKFTKLRIDELIKTNEVQSLYKLLQSYDLELAVKLADTDLKRITRGLAVYLETGVPLSLWQKDTLPFWPKGEFFVINLDVERQLLYKNCNERFIAMLASGALNEVETLINTEPEVKYPRILGLYELIDYIQGRISKEVAIERSQQLTRNYAKRQITWFKNQLSYDFILIKGYNE